MSTSAVFTLLGIFAGPVVAFLASYFFRRRDDGREIRKNAAYIAQSLDVFAYECVERISDNDTHIRSKGAMGELAHFVPKLEEFPEEVDMRLLSADAISKLSTLSLKGKLANRKISWDLAFVHEGTMDEIEETNMQCGVLGYEAFTLAKIVRHNAKLPSPNYEQF